MNPKLTTSRFLINLKACNSQLALFEKVFPRGARLSEANVVKAAKAGLNLDWLAMETLSGPARAEYEKARDSALAEFEKARVPALVEFEKACDPALAEYQKACNLAKYDKTLDPAYTEYMKVRGPAWAKYEKIRDLAWSDYQKVCGLAWLKLFIKTKKGETI